MSAYPITAVQRELADQIYRQALDDEGELNGALERVLLESFEAIPVQSEFLCPCPLLNTILTLCLVRSQGRRAPLSEFRSLRVSGPLSECQRGWRA